MFAETGSNANECFHGQYSWGERDITIRNNTHRFFRAGALSKIPEGTVVRRLLVKSLENKRVCHRSNIYHFDGKQITQTACI